MQMLWQYHEKQVLFLFCLIKARLKHAFCMNLRRFVQNCQESTKPVSLCILRENTFVPTFLKTSSFSSLVAGKARYDLIKLDTSKKKYVLWAYSVIE